MSRQPSAFQSECKRCGTCCRKGGPALHGEDRRLVEDGTIPLKHLYTIREGEPARDNVRNTLEPVNGDVIKIRARGSGWTCLYLDEGSNSCTIYDHRPAECRALTCWDTARIEALYARDRLNRCELLGAAEGIREVVEIHQQRCDYHHLAGLAASFRSHPNTRTAEPILEMVRYDYHLRERFCLRSQTEPAILDFLFGRALTVTARGFGLRVRSAGKKLLLETVPGGI
jgi:Fe-S-cluster containining protein